MQKKEQATSQIIIDVYSPTTIEIRLDGEFNPEPLDLYLEGNLIESTPMRFYQAGLDKLNLPSYEQIDTSAVSSWRT